MSSLSTGFTGAAQISLSAVGILLQADVTFITAHWPGRNSGITRLNDSRDTGERKINYLFLMVKADKIRVTQPHLTKLNLVNLNQPRLHCEELFEGIYLWHQKWSPAPGAQHTVPSTTANPSRKRTTHQERKGVFYKRVLGGRCSKNKWSKAK